MTKSETKELTKLMQAAQMGLTIKEPGMVAYAARGISALVRASRASRNQIITIAAGFPAVIQHEEFIV